MKHLVLISCWLLKKILVIATNLTNPESSVVTEQVNYK